MAFIKDALIQAFDEEMSRDSNVYIIGEEVGLSGGPKKTTDNLIYKFGYHRVLDTPISEIGFCGMAVGASYAGLRPIVDFMTWNFALQAIDHIINSAAKMSYMSKSKIYCPIVFRGPSGFNPGYGAQHVQDFFNVYGSIPGLKVIAPYTPYEHKALMKSAIRDDNPVVFLENEYLYTLDFPSENQPEEDLMLLDKCRILKEGKDITIIGISLSLYLIEKVSKEVQKEVEIINLISLNPIDYETIFESVRKTKKLIIVDYSWPNYSVAHEISSQVYEKIGNILDAPVKCLTGKDTHVGYSIGLEDLFYPSSQELKQIIENL